jgi:hypothetical protein
LVESGTDELLDYDRIREADQRLLLDTSPVPPRRE